MTWRLRWSGFRGASESVEAMLVEAGFSVLVREPTDPTALAGELCLVLARGAEPEAADWLVARQSGLPPVYVVGASIDHRVASGLVGRGARDYFCLPGDLDLFRRTLERVARQGAAVKAADGFATAERATNGFEAIIGESSALGQVITHGRRVGGQVITTGCQPRRLE